MRRRSYNMLAAFTALAAIGPDIMAFDIQGGNRDTPNSFSGKPKQVIPKGCQRYTFEDGWSTIASSQASANKKHDKYLKSL